MPWAHVEQRARRQGVHAWLFHEPVPLSALPRLQRSIARLDEALERAAAAHGLPASHPRSGGDGDPPRWPWQPWLAGSRPTLDALYGQTHFGAFQPLFGTDPETLATLARLEGAPFELRWREVDRLLGSAIFHELMHFGRDRDALMPPYLDEAVAGAVGVRFDPGSNVPHHPADKSLFGWPTFVQVGDLLARLVGEDLLLLAQAGLVPWDEALPAGLRMAALDLYWDLFSRAPAVHLHPDVDNPRPWARLFAEHAGPRWRELHPGDHERVRTAIKALGLERSGAGRARQGRPGRVTLDFAGGWAYPHERASAAPAGHLLPPVARLLPTLDVDDGFEAVDRVVRALELTLPPTAPTRPEDTP